MSSDFVTIYGDLADSFGRVRLPQTNSKSNILDLRTYMLDLFTGFTQTHFPEQENLFSFSLLGLPAIENDGKRPHAFIFEPSELEYGNGDIVDSIEFFSAVGGGWSRDEMTIALGFNEDTQKVEMVSWQHPKTQIYDMGFDPNQSLSQNTSNIIEKIIQNEMNDCWCERMFSCSFQHIKDHIIAKSQTQLAPAPV